MPTDRALFRATAVAAACLLSSCGFLSSDDDWDELTPGSVWEFTSIEYLPRARAGRGTSRITLELKEDGALRGHSFSNSYHGEYRLGSDNVFTVVDRRILTTLVGELEGSRYDDYLMFLSQAARYELRDGRLSILCGSRTRLHFTALAEN